MHTVHVTNGDTKVDFGFGAVGEAYTLRWGRLLALGPALQLVGPPCWALKIV